MQQIKVFTGSSHPELAALILERLGLGASPALLKRFSNGETQVEIGVSVRDADVFLIQSGSNAVNDHLMELMIMVNACKTASARRITVVLPYFPYSKQSKKKRARASITAKLVANMLTVAGTDHIISMDLHSSAIQGFFNKPVDNLLAEPTIAKYLMERFPTYATEGIVISKNAGGAKRVVSIADCLRTPFALIHREKYHVRESPEESGKEETKLTLVGDVRDKICFMVDDVIDGTHSFLDSCAHLKKCGAKCVVLVSSHGILSGDSLSQIESSPNVDHLIITNTYPMDEAKRKSSKKLEIIDISGVFAEAIRRTHNGESISYLFHTAL